MEDLQATTDVTAGVTENQLDCVLLELQNCITLCNSNDDGHVEH